MAIERKDLLALLVPLYPGLREHLVASTDDWLTEAGDISSCAIFTNASELVARCFAAGEFDGAQQLFNAVERCLTEGSEDVAAAAATCFLENLINQPEIGSLAVPHMGPRSKQHCRAWDEFTGATTRGLEITHNGA